MARTPEAGSQKTTDILGITMSRRAAAITIVRFGLGIAAGTLVMNSTVTADTAYSNAEKEAARKLPAPEQPTPAPKVVEVAKKIDILYADRQLAQTQPIHIPTGGDPKDNILMRGVLLKDKERQIGEADDQIFAYKASQEYRQAIAETIKADNEFAAKIASNREAITKESDRLKTEAGVSWYNPIYRGLGSLAMMGSAMITGYLPVFFKKPSWPFREIPATQPSQTPKETPQPA